MTKQHEESRRWLFIQDIQGHVAMWAVRQSPYHAPEGLVEALVEFRKRVETKFDKHGMAQLTRKEVYAMMKENLFSIPQVAAWNERKNGRQGMGFCSRYDQPTPDDDFIDLDALIRNSEVSLFRELDKDFEFGEKFDRDWKRGRFYRWLIGIKYKMFPCKPCNPSNATKA